MTFLDGTRATLTYPAGLRLGQDGARPYTTGGEPGGQVAPHITYGGISFRLSGRPVRCLQRPDGSLAGVWPHPDGDVLVLRFGKWVVSIFDRHTDLETWASHLEGKVTRAGWLVLRGDRELKIGPEQSYGDTSIMLGDLEPGVLLWPLRCRRADDTARDVVSGRALDGPKGKEAFASWCDPQAAMRVHVYASAAFIEKVAAGLRITDVALAHPIRRYHIVP